MNVITPTHPTPTPPQMIHMHILLRVSTNACMVLLTISYTNHNIHKIHMAGIFWNIYIYNIVVGIHGYTNHVG